MEDSIISITHFGFLHVNFSTVATGDLKNKNST